MEVKYKLAIFISFVGLLNVFSARKIEPLRAAQEPFESVIVVRELVMETRQKRQSIPGALPPPIGGNPPLLGAPGSPMTPSGYPPIGSGIPQTGLPGIPLPSSGFPSMGSPLSSNLTPPAPYTGAVPPILTSNLNLPLPQGIGTIGSGPVVTGQINPIRFPDSG